MSDAPIHILLATYNGGRHLKAQLDSIAGQSNHNWHLLVSDDGSTDETRTILDAFAAKCASGQVHVIEGPKAGATANFLHLIKEAPPGASLAFCDQDDVWLSDKLARAAESLSGLGKYPAQYSARTTIVDSDLRHLADSPRFARPFGLRNALVQACTAGNTSVFNPAAAQILKAGVSAACTARIVSHDWWAYQLIAAADGTILKDDKSVLLYRQHDQNEMGRNDTIRARYHRLALLFQGEFGGWLSANQRALAEVDHLLSPDARNIVSTFGKALREPGHRAGKLFRDMGLYRHDWPGTAALYAAAATGRLRQSQVSSAKADT